MQDPEVAALSGRIEALAHVVSFFLAEAMARRDRRERELMLDVLRYPFEPRAEHQAAAQPPLAQLRREAALAMLDVLAEQAQRLAPPPTDDSTA